MKPLRSPYDPDDPVIQAAGAWLSRRDRGFTPAEQVAFESWATKDPSHASAVAKIEASMRAFDRLRPVDASEPNPDLFSPTVRQRRWVIPTVTGLAAAIAVLVWLSQRSPVPANPHHFSTLAGGYQRTTLTDGTVLELNSSSTVDLAFTPSARQVYLRTGEAHFKVTNKATQPFIVTVGFVDIRVLGTAFSVRSNPSGVEVLVIEGKVQVDSRAPAPTSPPPPPTLLEAGQKLTLEKERHAAASPPAPIAVSAKEIEQALAWQPRLLDFSKTPLTEVVKKFNQANRVQIVIDDPSLGTVEVGGSFRADQVDAFIRLLEQSFDITAERSSGAIHLKRGE